VLSALHQQGVRLVVLRCAGFNNVDLPAAEELGLKVVRVRAYSPYTVAEHTVGLILSLNRKIHRAYNRVREGNFSLDGLLGFDMHGRRVGVIGTGHIGSLVVRILCGMGCRVLAHVKDGVMLINTSRGAVMDAEILVSGLKSGKIGYPGLDVYEQEGDLFFEDLSDKIIQDDVFERLVTFPNVLITGHQGYFTEDALRNFAQTSLANARAVEQGQPCENELTTAVRRDACK